MEVLLLFALGAFFVYRIFAPGKTKDDRPAAGTYRPQTNVPTPGTGSPDKATVDRIAPEPYRPQASVPTLRTGWVSRCHLAGLPHHRPDVEAAMRTLRVGQRLGVVRERSNSHDVLAIMLTANGEKIGYVPRSCNKEHALHLDAGGTIEVKVTAINTGDKWQGVSLTVTNG